MYSLLKMHLCECNCLTAAFLLMLSIQAIIADARSTPTNGRYAQGNLAVVFDTKIGKSSEHHPILTNLSSLWCQATENGEDRLKIKHARFVRVSPPPPKTFEADLNRERTRATLNFGIVTALSSIGKYKCEITTESNNYISGNMFVYLRPILHVSNNLPRVELMNKDNPYSFMGSSTQATANDTVILNCPVIGYPFPEIEWFKNNERINQSAMIDVLSSEFGPFRKYVISGGAHNARSGNKLQINQATEDDEGFYKCVARNVFSQVVNGQPMDHELTLEQYLRVSSSMAWLVPLAVIILLLILLILTIYLCSLLGRHRTNEYNVAQKEREMGRNEGQKLNNGLDE